MRRTLAVLAAVLMTALTGGVAHAANPHFIGEPVITVDGTTVNASGSVAGLGNTDIDVTLEATGTAAIECTNPGGNVAPGQNTEIDVSGTQTDIETKNGRAFFNVTTGEPEAPTGVCPNPKWTADIVSVDFTSATLIVTQDGEVVLVDTADL